MNRRADLLYLATVEDLERLLSEPTPYNVLRASLLVRQLIGDNKQSLAVRCNRSRRIKLRYTIFREPLDLHKTLGGEMICSMENPDVFDFPATEAQAQVSLDEFMGRPALLYKGESFSVNDVLRFCQYVLGGVHFGDPATPRDHLMMELEESLHLRPFGQSMAIEILKGVGSVTLKALHPLTATIRGAG